MILYFDIMTIALTDVTDTCTMALLHLPIKPFDVLDQLHQD